MVIEVLIVFGHVTICSSATSVSALNQGPSDALSVMSEIYIRMLIFVPVATVPFLLVSGVGGQKTNCSEHSELAPFPRRLTSAYLLNCSITCLQLGSLNSIYHLSLVLLPSSRLLRACSRNGRSLPLSQNLIAPESALTKQS